jgi:hypothetical protein|tara:strand:+ start:555 stop:713 length:159 start_codon:yes stop_codon:yes gene_type:complete
MPFKSSKQRKYLFANKPGVAKKMAKKKYGHGGSVLTIVIASPKKGKKNDKKK